MTARPASVTGGPDPADEAAIRRCIADYYDGYFTADPVRMRRALHPDLVKRSVGSGFVKTLSADDMVQFTADGGGSDSSPADRAWAVEALDVRGDIAAAVVISTPFVDYVHLGRLAGMWQIVNVMWSNR